MEESAGGSISDPPRGSPAPPDPGDPLAPREIKNAACSTMRTCPLTLDWRISMVRARKTGLLLWTRRADALLRGVPPCAAGEPGESRTFGPDRGRRLAMPAKLFVGNLSFQATEEDLRELFQQAGTVESVRIVTDQFTGRPRGFGFVEMTTKEESAKAIEMLNGRLFRDRNLVVDEARPQPQRGAGGGGPRGGGGGPRTGGPGGGGGGWRR